MEKYEVRSTKGEVRRGKYEVRSTKYEVRTTKDEKRGTKVGFIALPRNASKVEPMISTNSAGFVAI